MIYSHGVRSGVITLLFCFANGCVDQYSFQQGQGDLAPPNSDLCTQNPNADACKRDPVVTTPGVVTILFTMQQIPQNAATLILANAIKYASPLQQPRILFLKDSATFGEDEGDSDFIMNTLLLGYDVEYKVIAGGGLTPAEVNNKDLVIISNPGHPLANLQTLTTLQAFAGGVILLGDDLSRGSSFSMDAFTGLTFKDNGSSMSCNGQTYQYDNLQGHNYQVSMNSIFLPGIPAAYQHYSYGNDIDITVAGAGVQVLAWAEAEAGTCNIGQIPAVARKPR